MKKTMQKLVKVMILGAFIAVVGLVAYGFISGELQFVETLRLGGESRGYFGRKARLLDTEAHFVQEWNRLAETSDLAGKSFRLKTAHISTKRMRATVQDPTNDRYYDEYDYNAQSIFNMKWIKKDPVKNPNDVWVDFQYEDVDPVGIYRFYEQVKAYIDQNRIPLDDDSDIFISINNFSEQFETFGLRATVSGERETLSFRADPQGQNFEVLP